MLQVGEGDGVMEGVHVAVLVIDGVGVGVCDGVGVAETQMKGPLAPTVAFSAPVGKRTGSAFGHCVQATCPGPL